jgi:DNA polymerase-3 subunit gamma/tau
MYQVIARKYRPQTFAELIGQEHVRATVENAIAQRRIAHGYIFSGQRGTGKTTVARILARCLNCVDGPAATPCGVCASCVETANGASVDVIEIDAASNRGINEMRELRENVRYRPARDRYKVFIIDEAHQITNEAFNALLKTLEEPPEWAVFVLCTTEAHKIPATIASRCQQFQFRQVGFEEVVGRMAWICGQEGIEADSEALAALAQAGEGSVRDSLSALDQAIACCGNTLEAAQVRELLGMFSLEALDRAAAALKAADARAMLDIVMELERDGRNLQHFSRELSRYFRNVLVARVAGPEPRLISATAAERDRLAATAQSFSEEDLTRYLQLSLDLFRDLQYSLQPRLQLELGLLRMIHAGRMMEVEEALAVLGGSGSVEAPKAVLKREAAAPPAAPVAPSASARVVGGDAKATMLAVLEEMKMQFTFDAVSHSAVTENGGELVFVTPAAFRIAMNEKDLARVAEKAFGRAMRVKVTIGEGAAGPSASASQATSMEASDAAPRALSHPEVKRFQEAFPGAQVRAVRDLKE